MKMRDYLRLHILIGVKRDVLLAAAWKPVKLVGLKTVG
jgi:hypothetical protein